MKEQIIEGFFKYKKEVSNLFVNKLNKILINWNLINY